MMKRPAASQVVELRGQHMEAEAELPTQVEAVQSWTAPMVWPISWAITLHSVDVRATTLTPLTKEPSSELVVASLWQSWPSHARPTDEPVSQVVRRVHRARLSLERWPLHWENRFRRVSMVVLSLQGTFHLVASGAVAGQLALLMTSCERPRVMLKVLSYRFDLNRSAPGEEERERVREEGRTQS